MKADLNDSSQTLDDEGADEMSEREIDGNLEDTFPASDPPAWGPASIGGSGASASSA